MQRDVYSAIADPTRREIIGMLSGKSLNVNEISDRFPMTRTAVSKHMRILKECGILKVQKQGRERYCRVNLEALADVANWVNQYRMFWNSNLDRLESLLKNDSDNEKK